MGLSSITIIFFEDGSGEKFRNRPDGLYGLYFTRKKFPQNGSKKFRLTNFIIPNARVAPSTMIRSAERSSEVTIIISITEFISRVDILRSSDRFALFPQTGRSQRDNPGVLNNRFYAHHLEFRDLPGDIRYKLMMSYS